MAEIDGGRIAARQLNALGIDHLFGVVAGPMIELFGGAQSEGMTVIGNRLELNGCFMASAWGWQKKKPGEGPEKTAKHTGNTPGTHTHKKKGRALRQTLPPAI